jgi:hypothetical protein
MVDFSNIKKSGIYPPDTWTWFGSPEEFDRFPQEHKDQILFLNKEASKFLQNFLKNTKMLGNHSSIEYDAKQPFPKNYFKTVEEYTNLADDDVLKKWLYNRAIPFKHEVFLLAESDSIITTWKIIVKYAPGIFSRGDVIVFDQTTNWCLFFHHEDHIYFGKNNTYDPEIGYDKMKELSEVKRKNPNLKFPY